MVEDIFLKTPSVFLEAETVCGSDGISGCDPKMSKGKGGWWKVAENGECTAIEETGHEIHTGTD